MATAGVELVRTNAATMDETNELHGSKLFWSLMPPKYNWEQRSNDDDRGGNVRRITTDAGRQHDSERERLREDYDERYNGRSGVQGQRYDEIERRTNEEYGDGRDLRFYNPDGSREQSPNVDRRYLIFPEAGEKRMSEEEHKRNVDLLLGRHVEGLSRTVQEKIGDFVRAVIFGGHDAHRVARDPYNRAWLESKHSRVFNEGTVGSPGDAGTVIPPGYLAEILREPMASGATLYSLSRKIGVTTNEGKMPTLAALPTIIYPGESTEITEDADADLGELDYRCYKRAVLSKISKEAAADSNPACVELLVSMIQESLAEERERCIAYGSGSGRPTGLYQSSGLTDVSGITSISWNNLNALLFSVHERYRNDPSFCWTFNSNVEAAIMKLADSNGQPFFVNNPALEKFPRRLMGYPCIVSDYLPSTYISCQAMRNYLLFDRGLMTLQTTDQAGDSFVKDQVWIKLTERQGGNFHKPGSRVAGARSKILSGITAYQTLPE